MFNFTIFARDSWCDVQGGGRHRCLSRDVFACYHSDYHAGGYRSSGTIENIICTLKNDVTPYPDSVLDDAVKRLHDILEEDLKEFSKMAKEKGYSSITVCVIPRAKAEKSYNDNQKLFRKTVQDVVKEVASSDSFYVDGTYNIIRHTDTATTHLSRHAFQINGTLPYCGITKDTCEITNVQGKVILLIDDLYTKTVCIDEDALQALFDNGARQVFFYSIGRTVHKEI